MIRVKLFADEQTDGRTDQKLYAHESPDNGA